MAPPISSSFSLGHEFRSREARDHLKDVLDRAESGGVAVIRRTVPVVVLHRDAVGAALQAAAPVPVLSSVSGGQFFFWVEGAPIHAVGDGLTAAEEAFLDALVDYAQAWFDGLNTAPNHKRFRNLALLVGIYAGDRAELHRVIFGDD
ncbi:hypothetical protein [Iamia sp.]|uniref:hypothetical protein n=1 Tax=Iamia sp. TaxID=2722710 RepID=UPI002BFD5E77|nr:hypothetical protein [Iamia sp.]HXH56966.1 hypothetical protein [Iamia sp.]